MRCLAILGGVLLLAGCGTFRPEPRLPFPPAPEVEFWLREGAICMTERDARAFIIWLDQLGEFKAARERLLEGR